MNVLGFIFREKDDPCRLLDEAPFRVCNGLLILRLSRCEHYKSEPVEKSLDIGSLEDGKTFPAKCLLSYSTNDKYISDLPPVYI